ncbi:MAG: OsmC family protein [Burkholderiales bacterium]|nr:OsmC family protein [Burkholderiales bacterium]
MTATVRRDPERHEYTATVEWQRGQQEAYTDNRYSRRHELRFDGGAVWAGSSSPLSVPLPMSDASAVDPEEMLVAATSSCHMLWFLSLAAQRGLRVDRYLDEAVATLARDAEGRMAITVVTLRPLVTCSGPMQPDAGTLRELHHRAHESCYIARSIRAELRCEPRFD